MADAFATALRASEPRGIAPRAASPAGPVASHGTPRHAAGGTSADVLRFGRFRCLPYQRLLLEGDRPVSLGSRAFDILVVLLDRHSEVVGKDDLIAEVWPDTHVEDGNLRVHITALRRALGDDDDSRFIRTVPGRGYRFIAPVSRVDQPRAPADAMAPPTSPQSNLPVSLTRMFGRSDVVGALAAQLPPRRAVTIVGPGGIGKTTVALAAAEALAARYPDGVHVVDLVPVAGPPQLAASFAEALGLAPAGDGADLIRGLIDRRMLIVFDNCEQLIGPTAELIERICRGTSHVHVLATSREPLRHADEWVRRLPPLRCPPPDERLSAEEALAYPAIELFVDRMSASDGPCGLDDDNAATVAAICRRLDGVPLAIELAANRVHAFGIKGLMAQLDEPLRLLSGGRRTADARHQTLSGMLDWSYRTLSEPECAVLRRLAIFPDEFTLAAACAVAGDSDGADVVEGIAALVSKSLVIADVSDATTRYRLLATTRNYALAKLTASGELDAIARRHAEHAAGQVVSA